MKKNVLLAFFLGLAGQLAAINWPLDPIGAPHALGNNWGEYQNYGGGPYFHNGIDVFPPAGHYGVPVRAVAHGWVKGWGTIEAEYHWRLAVSDSPPGFTGRAPGWLYAHIDSTRPHRRMGDEVNTGDTIGFIVRWPVNGFDHTHFARISDTGLTWSRFPNPTWWFIRNPLLDIQSTSDTVPPAIQGFALCRNNSEQYISDLTAVTGDVDIVVRAYDKIGFPTSDPTWDRQIPYEFDWSVRGSLDSVPTRLGLIFSGLLPDYLDTLLVGVIYKQAEPCVSQGDYTNRDYYFIVTNNADGDSTIDMGDAAGCWRTESLLDDDYWIRVTARDVAGNATVDSMRVHTANGNRIGEKGVAGSWHGLESPTMVRAGANLAVSFVLARAEPVRLQLFDAAGRLEGGMSAGVMSEGRHTLEFVPRVAGVHLLVLTSGQDRVVHKLTVVR